MKGAQTIRIAHVITALEVGGAELKLYRLLKYFQGTNAENVVVSLAAVGTVGEKIKQLGVPVFSIGMKPGKVPSLYHVLRLLRIVRNIRPHVIQGWMYHGNLAATIAWLFRRENVRLIWNIRQSLGDLNNEASLTRKVIRVSAWLSRIPETIIYNSRQSAQQHERYGLAVSKTVYIPNGFYIETDVDYSKMCQGFRREQLIEKDTFLVGHIARFHPKKDHQVLIAASHHVVQKHKNVVFVAIGRDVVQSNPELWIPIDNYGLEKRFLLLGERDDIHNVMGSLDLLVSSSSWGEGFPNVVGEAMAAGVPCVVTNVGESSSLVGSSGLIVEPGDSLALGEAILKFLDMSPEERNNRSKLAKDRIADHFSIEKIGRKYLSLYCSSN